MGGEVSHQAGDYHEPELPEGVFEVRLSVYKLELTGVGLLDRVGASLVGAYHTGVVVANEEWAFGGHDVLGKSGVYRTKPELNMDYIFYRRETMGHIQGEPRSIVQQIKQLARTDKWLGPNYDLIDRNCNHFSSDLCWMLLQKRPPDWVNGTAESMALSRRRKEAEQLALFAALSQYSTSFGQTGAEASPAEACLLGDPETRKEHQMNRFLAAPGAKAFQDTFTATFEMSWSTRRERIAQVRASPGSGEDTRALRSAEEKAQIQAASAAAITAAFVVARVAREAAEVRATQPLGAGQTAWDDAWARASWRMLRSWKEQAIAGTLDPDPSGPQGAERAQLVAAALDEACFSAQLGHAKGQKLAARRAELEKGIEEAAAVGRRRRMTA